MGYTTHAECDLLGLGVSAISHIGESFSQNFRELKKWESALAAGRLPVWRGLTMSADDRVRGAVIGQLMCQGVVDIGAIEERYDIDFAAYFAEALARLAPHVADGLVCLADEEIIVTRAGRMLLRSIAMCFDAYLSVAPLAAAPPPSFSRVV
jgi:oxygen-independent coproporphyrinogen-3 oxidase